MFVTAYSSPPTSAFSVSSRREGDAIVISVSGELDLATVPELDRALAAAAGEQATPIFVDLGACTFIDSTAINALLRCYMTLADGTNGSAAGLTIAGARGHVRRTLELTKVEEVITVTG